MDYFELSMALPVEFKEAAMIGLNLLLEEGFTYKQTGRSLDITVYFKTVAESETFLFEFESFLLRSGADPASLVSGAKVVSDEDWLSGWKRYFKPARITPRIVIKPSWEEYLPKEGEMVIEIDPAMAFGTGLHPTTKGCIMLLEEEIKGGERVIDFGTGSGILMLAALKLGARCAVGIDNDPLAIEAAERNIKKSGLESRSEFILADLDGLETRSAEILVSNIEFKVALALIDRLQDLTAKPMVLILSGLLIEEGETIISRFERAGYNLKKRLEAPPWLTLVGEHVSA